MTDRIIIPEKVITKVTGRALPKPGDNQTTEAMVYGGELNRITFKGYGKDLFACERYKNRDKNGEPIPEHPLNDPKYAGAKILIGGENYGCGSSREHAPQAHKDYGFEALITSGYAEIFQGNCASIGLVAITISAEEIAELVDLVQTIPSIKFEIDLEEKLITYGLESSCFDMPEATRQSFLDGTWDALALLRANEDEVKAKMKEIPYFSFK